MTQLLSVIFFGLAAIWFGLRVFLTPSMMRSALSLLFSMTALGAVFLALQAEFLGVLQIMMMAAEMAIMAIFMIMYMMNPGGLAAMEMTHQKRLAIGAGALGGLLALAAAVGWRGVPLPAAPAPGVQLQALGAELLERSMLVFETAGITILVAMIAATATAVRRHG